MPCTTPGTQSHLTVVRYGAPGARPKAYLQASLHADEIPGMLVLDRLRSMLEAAPGAVTGELVLVPVANPLGLVQNVSGRVLGRHALTGAGNYNRLFPDLAAPAAERLAGRLGADAASNVAAVRGALAAALAELTPADETQWLRHTLLGLALDADIALDLHCDEEALLHVYLGTPLWPQAADLSAGLEAAVEHERFGPRVAAGIRSTRRCPRRGGCWRGGSRTVRCRCPVSRPRWSCAGWWTWTTGSPGAMPTICSGSCSAAG